MTKMHFVSAAERVQDEVEAEGAERPKPKILEWDMAGQEFRANLPTTTQIILLSAASDSGTLRSIIIASMTFLEGIMLDDGYARLRKLVSSGVVGHDLLIGGDDANEQGIVDWIVSQVTDGRPTKSPSDFSQSQKKGGRRSTGRAPGKGSIPSGSPSAVS